MRTQSPLMMAALSMGVSLAAAPATVTGDGPTVRRKLRPTAKNSALINRWTGKPHEHRRQIERRLRQARTIAQHIGEAA